MEIAFSTPQIRKLCEDPRRAQKDLGNEIADKLQRRLADLESASNIFDLIVGDPKFTDEAQGRGILTLHLANCTYLTAESNHPKVPRTKQGKVNWDKVSHLKILTIAKAHG